MSENWGCRRCRKINQKIPEDWDVGDTRRWTRWCQMIKISPEILFLILWSCFLFWPLQNLFRPQITSSDLKLCDPVINEIRWESLMSLDEWGCRRCQMINQKIPEDWDTGDIRRWNFYPVILLFLILWSCLLFWPLQNLFWPQITSSYLIFKGLFLFLPM
jgi:hypothetical protein